jgi:hypothetical protein
MFGGASRSCGDAEIADELTHRLTDFPPQLQWLFLQHIQKNPFPDQPMSFINLWKVGHESNDDVDCC